MKTRKIILFTLIFFIILTPVVVTAQEAQPELQLRLVRKFGYGGFGRIQGRFTLKIDDPPDDLTKIEYYLGNELIATMFEPPHEYTFHTSYYQEGEHTVTAIGYLKGGRILESNNITKTFISSDQAWSDTQRLIVPLLLVTAGLTVLGLGVPLIIGKKKDFVIGKYGPAGAAICPRCHYPFSRSVFAPNLLVGKLVRCPHCGKTSVQARASSNLLQEAEDRYSSIGSDQEEKGEELDFNKMLEDSRFED